MAKTHLILLSPYQRLRSNQGFFYPNVINLDHFYQIHDKDYSYHKTKLSKIIYIYLGLYISLLKCV